MLENGVATTYAYDVADQLTTLVHANAAGELARFAYAYDTGGRRTAKTTTGSGAIARAETYGYDAIDQLTSAAYGAAGNETFAYDAMGNRTSATLLGWGTLSYAANALNQFTTVTPAGGAAFQPAYDANGNTLTLPGRAYAYDGQSRLASATLGTVGQPGYHAASFVYDARNRQVSRTVDGQTTYFVWDGWSLLAEYEVSGGAPVQTARYVHGPRLDEVLVQIRGTASSPVFLQEDGLGSTYLLTNAAGVPVERYAYTAYGEVSAFDNSGNALATPTTRFLYTGREWIAELGLNDHRHRFYLPSFGRFISRDPIKERGGLNLYGYVENNPINWVDPLGLAPGDPYPTMDQAGAQAIRDINPTSIKENREYAGWIYKNKDGTYSYTKPKKGDKDGSYRPFTPFKDKCGDYHTHAAYDPAYANGNENFSKGDGGDMDINDKEGRVGYLGTPSGQIKKYTPVPGQPQNPANVTVIGTGAK